MVFAALFIAAQYLHQAATEFSYFTTKLLMLLVAMVSIFLVVALSIWLSRFRLNWLLALGASSMIIYLMHVLAGSGTRIVLHSMLHIDSFPVQVVAGTIMGLTLPLVAKAVIGRYKLGFLLVPPRRISVERRWVQPY
jgi:peptidoglycan/LPS O-acetylase OafA/YrhL